MNTVIPIYIGEILAHLRKERQKTQQQLAEESGLGYRTIQDLEANRQQPKLGTAFALAHSLEICPSEFFLLIYDYYSRERNSPLPAESEEGDRP